MSYKQPVGDWPTGRANPELLKLHPSHGHDQTIVNGISRIGYMTGGKAALWKDEDMADVFTRQATGFIERQRSKPFFLFFSLHDPHVPRVPHPRFAGVTPMGPRGDAIAQADWCVGEILATLDRLGLADDQVKIIKGAPEKYRDEQRQAWQALRTAQKELRQLALNGADASAIQAKTAEVQQRIGLTVAVRVKVLQEIGPVLTPEQRAKFAEGYGHRGMRHHRKAEMSS